MSEKSAKLNRKAQAEADALQKKAGEQILFQVVATVLKNGQVHVGGFPTSLSDSVMIVSDINKAIMTHFVTQASAGNVNSRGVINQKQNKILTPDGKPHNAISKILKPGDAISDIKKDTDK